MSGARLVFPHFDLDAQASRCVRPARSRMFEHRSSRLAPPRVFALRMALSLLVAVALILVSLAAGMLGYRAFEHLGWLDAFTNAAMLLSGMGPLAPLQTPAGKLFAGLYAIYSGFVVIAIGGIMLAPVAHRLLHRFHLETEEDERDGRGKG